nr:MAG TPA: hypothetical protein [Caudoviricetes sp.]
MSFPESFLFCQASKLILDKFTTNLLGIETILHTGK